MLFWRAIKSLHESDLMDSTCIYLEHTRAGLAEMTHKLWTSKTRRRRVVSWITQLKWTDFNNFITQNSTSRHVFVLHNWKCHRSTVRNVKLIYVNTKLLLPKISPKSGRFWNQLVDMLCIETWISDMWSYRNCKKLLKLSRIHSSGLRHCSLASSTIPCWHLADVSDGAYST